MRRIPIIFYCLVICLVASAQADLKKLDAYYQKALTDWNVPGMSIGIVKDGKLVFAKGYGVLEAGRNGRPDENTLYAIASNSKAFTSVAIARLVDEGKLSWDDKVRKYLPYFELYDPWVSSETTIRDLLCHRVGLGTFSGDLIWYRSKLSGEEIVRRVKYLPKEYDFRAGYGYSNVMYITAGEVIRKITGKSWGEYVRDVLLMPLGMSRTVWSTTALAQMENVATPHLLAGDAHSPMEWENWEHVAATGGIISSVKDMSQWMIFNLNHGIWNDDTLISASSRDALWTPHNNFTVSQTDANALTRFNGYGLGWFLKDYRGKQMVWHTGGYSGMLSAVALIPDEKLGVVILTNGLKGIYTPLVNYTIDAFLKAPVRDWSSERLSARKKFRDTRIEERRMARVLNTKPSVSVDACLGEYVAPAYGRITISGGDGKMRISFEHTPDLTATLVHWHYDVWELKWERPEVLPWFTFGTVRFETDNDAKVTGISFDVPNDDFLFSELNAKKVKQ